MTRRPSPALILWLLFIVLSITWGSSYFFIKVGVEEGLQPFTLIAWRLGIAIAALLALVALTRSRLPRDPATLARLAFLGVINVAIPFALITWAEQFIGSALASILQGLVPLFAIVFAGLVLHDEPITVNRVVGLVVGFAGAVILLGRHLAPTAGSDPAMELVGELAVVASCVSYAASGVFIRRYFGGQLLVRDPRTGPRALRPVEIALPQNAAAFVLTAIAALALERSPGGGIPVPPTGIAWLSVAWLGVLGSAVAYLMYFRILNAWGVTRTSLVTYVMPIVGIVLGVLVLRETIDAQVIVGTALVIGGIGLVNSQFGQRRLFGRSAAVASD